MRIRVVVAVGLATVGMAGAAGAQAPVPLSLREAVTRAAEQTAGVRVAGAELEAAVARVGEARGALLPQLSASAMDMNRTFNLYAMGITLPTAPGEPPMPPLVGPFANVDARVRLNQTLFDPASYLRMKTAQVGVTGSSAQEAAAREAAAVKAAMTYLRVVRAQSVLEARKADAALAGELLELAETQLQSGVSTVIDVTRARTQKVAADGATLVAQNASEQAQIELARALGESPATRYQLTDGLSAESLVGTIPLNADSLVALAIARRPELKLAEAAGNAASTMKRAIRAERLPRVDLFADYGASGLHPNDAIATREVGVQVSIPLLDGLRREARLDEQSAVQKEADLRADDLRDQVRAEVAGALLDLKSGEQQSAIAAERLQLAEDELSQAKERFSNGVAGNIELINAQASLNHARDAEIDARYTIATAQAALARAAGVAAGIR
jgi:outer membrane protein TolC